MKCIAKATCDYMDAQQFFFEDGSSFKINHLEIHQHLMNGGSMQQLLMNKYYEMIKERTLEEQKKLQEHRDV